MDEALAAQFVAYRVRVGRQEARTAAGLPAAMAILGALAVTGRERAQVEAVNPDGSYREIAVFDPTGVFGE